MFFLSDAVAFATSTLAEIRSEVKEAVSNALKDAGGKQIKIDLHLHIQLFGINYAKMYLL